YFPGSLGMAVLCMVQFPTLDAEQAFFGVDSIAVSSTVDNGTAVAARFLECCHVLNPPFS
ncbi:MAG: hypothetical protein WC657_06340, partial [Candidatus Paceibacterota bacterium]